MKQLYIISLIFISTLGYSQNSVGSDAWYSKNNNDEKVSYNADVNYNMSVGTSFSSFGPNQNAFSYYAAPSATIPMSERFSLTVGFVMNQTQYSGMMMGPEGAKTKNYTQTQAIVYASGSYIVNPNVTVFASGYYDMNARNNPAGQNSAYNPYNPYGSEGFSLGAEFKIGEKTRIGVQFQYDKGGNPYMNPYGGFGMGNNGRVGMGRNPYGPY
ncbi:MAG: hypothetical protein KAH10_06225 [Flavobacteriales bacterium]|nr:hypothetical protein [Flavobacteriales bacterium]